MFFLICLSACNKFWRKLAYKAHHCYFIVIAILEHGSFLFSKCDTNRGWESRLFLLYKMFFDYSFMLIQNLITLLISFLFSVFGFYFIFFIATGDMHAGS